MEKTTRKSSLITALVLGTGLAVGGAMLAPASAQTAPAQTAAPAASVKLLTIGEVHDKLVAQGYRDIDEIEREGRSFEVKGVDAQGRRVKLDVDGVTGEVLHTRVKGERRGRH